LYPAAGLALMEIDAVSSQRFRFVNMQGRYWREILGRRYTRFQIIPDF